MNAPNFRLNEGLQLKMYRAVRDQAHSRIAVAAGWGSGKTFGLAFVARYVANRWPGSVGVWVTDTVPRLRSVVMPMCEVLLKSAGWAFRQTESRWVAPNGSILYVKGYHRPSTRETSSNSLEGINAHYALIDESQTMTAEVLKVLTGRTRTKYQGSGGEFRNFIMSVGLPVYNAWWVKRAIENPETSLVLKAGSDANSDNLNAEFFEDAKRELDEEEFEAFVKGNPLPLKGQVYKRWSPKPWPEGNVLDDWQPSPDREVTMGVDPGHNPSALFFQHDPERNIDVLIAEVCPYDVTLDVFVRRILQVGWPRRLPRGKPPGVKLWLDSMVIDKAGKSGDRYKVSEIDDLARPPVDQHGRVGGGIGIRGIPSPSDPIRANPEERAKRMHRLIYDPHTELRRLVVMRDVWERGLRVPETQRSFAKMIQRLKYRDNDSGLIYRDTGKGRVIDVADAFGYWGAHYRWHDRRITSKLKVGNAATGGDIGYKVGGW